jgi:glycosyltransferase involved in cell wall biosynthesis
VEARPDALRIAITVDPNIPVPPTLYGGIERVADFLVRGLVSRGHDVTILAHPASRTAGRLVPYGRRPHTSRRSRLTELWQVGAYLTRHLRSFDLIHSFGRLAALVPVLPARWIPKIQSYQRDEVPWSSVRTAVRLGGRSVAFTGCSTSVYRDRDRYGASAGTWHTIFNGADLSKYTLSPAVAADAPLVFLGRLEWYKGPQHAIAIARRAGRRLVIAGPKKEDGEGPAFFEREIAPQLDEQITWVGQVDDEQKNALLGSAAAFLMPIEWEEPFGIVMAEALACGTPVIGYPRGSVPEVVRDGVNGFIADSVERAAAAVARLAAIDRRAVRADCEARFSDRAIVDAYLALYRAMIEATA